MSKPQSNENLTEIVRRGKSRPARKWLITLTALALAAGGAWYYYSHNKGETEKPEYVTEAAKRGWVRPDTRYFMDTLGWTGARVKRALYQLDAISHVVTQRRRQPTLPLDR